MKKVLLDCDNCMGSPFWEVDDGLVIIYLLNKPEALLMGITTTFGNRSYKHEYTQRLLKETGRTDIPLFMGAQKSGAPATEASAFLAETAAEHPGEISLIAAGPLGNIAAAGREHPDFYSNLKEIILMGGTTEPLKLGTRNVKELNLSADTDAAAEVLHAPCPITVMNSQICLESPFYFRDLKRLSSFPRRWKRYLRNWLITNRLGTGLPCFFLWDLLLPVYLFHPDLFRNRIVELTASPEDLAQGLLVWRKPGAHAKTVNMPDHIIDRDQFMDELISIWNRQGKKLNR